MRKGLIYVAIIILIFIFFSAVYVVDETEQVIVTQFGKAIGNPKTDPGLYFKLPIIQQANYFPKNLLEWDGDPGQIPTLDKTFIWVDTFARWKIVDPLKFFETVNNVYAGLGRLDDIIDPAVRNFITSFPLIETVRMTNRELDTFEVGIDEVKEISPLGEVKTGRAKITKGIMEQAQPKLAEFGIELVDVRIKRVNYIEEVRKSVYDRMIEERNSIAETIRSEGEEQAKIIEGAVKKQLAEITSKAYKEAQRIKGEADGEAARIYAEAYNEDPEFYAFLKSLEVYSAGLDENSQLILDTQTDLWQYIKRLKPAPASVSP